MKQTILCLLMGIATAGCPGSAADEGDGDSAHDLGGSASDQGGAARGSGSLGLISSNYMAAGMPFKSSIVSASFSTAAMGPSCMSQTMGACQVSTCQLSMPASSPAAGNISITGGTKQVSLMPKTDGSYAVYTDTMNTLWTGGETLNIMAAGGVVPAFSATITAPVTAQLTMPAPPAMGVRLVVNRSMDLILKWTGGQGDSIQAVLSTPVSSGKTLAVGCTFAAGDSTGTIPAAALMNLQAGSGSLTVYSGNVKMMSVADYDLSVSAFSLALDNNGQAASYGATYQ